MIFDKPTLRTQVVVRRRHRRARRPPDAGRRRRWPASACASRSHDVARVLGRQASVIVWRTFAQADLEEMAEHAGVPVVNALTDDFHPCQLLADLLTVREHKGELAGLTVAFVGDGACNMGNSWLLAGATAGMHVRISSPEGYAPSTAMVERAAAIAATTGGSARPRARPGRGRRPAPTSSSPTPGSRWARRTRPRPAPRSSRRTR